MARLPKAARLLRGVDVYVADGASPRRPILRRRDGAFIGHAPMVEQLRWCRRAGVRLAIFTHCGSQVVRADARELRTALQRLGEEASVEVRVACDGDQVASPFGASLVRRRRRG